MDKYIPIRELASHFRLNKGDNVFVTSDVKALLYDCIQQEDETDIQIIIDGIIDIIGPKGTLVFPTFNWAFCKGEPYDHYKTPCKTGSLGKEALKRDDFKRTKHPIYSFAVWGKGQEEMCATCNHSSFGIDSPFTYMLEHNFRNLFIDKDLQHSFVFVHYVEETVGPVPYRYLKDFTADYTDEKGRIRRATYSMNVRDLDLDVENVIYAYEPEFIEKGVMQRFFINDLEYKIIELKGAFPIIAEDVRHNRSRRLCSYIGQNDDEAYLPVGKEMFKLCEKMYPINRSITGDGVRDTFKLISKIIPDMKLYEIPTGTKAFDWEVPKEWNITEGYLEGPDGERIVDMKDSNLHILGYSVPVDTYLSLEELNEHLYSLDDQPDLFPYVTSYYKERWGFSLSKNQRDKLKPGTYHAVIKSTLTEGSLTYGELIIPGETSEEIFISSYTCHPSMANNECSGPAVLTYLAKYVQSMPKRRYTYRFVLAPETIGALVYLSRNLDDLKSNVVAAFNLTCVGDDRTYSIVHSKYADTLADKVLTSVLKYHYPKFIDYSYLYRGSDERQYQAPGADIPMVALCRSKFHVYPEYHTSADNMNIISPDGLAGSYEVMVKCIEALEHNRIYKIKTIGEPKLGKYGLVPTMSSKETYQETLILKDVCAYADGKNDLFDLSKLLSKPVDAIIPVIDKLWAAGLLEEVIG